MNKKINKHSIFSNLTLQRIPPSFVFKWIRIEMLKKMQCSHKFHPSITETSIYIVIFVRTVPISTTIYPTRISVCIAIYVSDLMNFCGMMYLRIIPGYVHTHIYIYIYVYFLFFPPIFKVNNSTFIIFQYIKLIIRSL